MPIYVKLRFVGPDSTFVDFSVKSNTKMKHIMNAYCERFFKKSSIYYHFYLNDEVPVRESDTPFSLNLKSKDVINVYETVYSSEESDEEEGEGS